MKRLAMLLLICTGAAHADGLGRLFFRAEERAALDAARAGVGAPQERSEIVEPQRAEEIEVPAATGAAVSVEGYVLRRRGDGTAWVNGRGTPQEELAVPGAGPALRLTRDGVVVQAPEGGPHRLVKPGQSWDPAQDRLRDAYEGARAGRAKP
ncbi:MAG: hypothetical protein HY749_14270 [Gammaproteobacteria bacterium]|nr:hypothetical protein [Gammaproteobacteria bacterium]MBI5617564.1 hypothetical protein [Gammaproteobacteria bacterium]